MSQLDFGHIPVGECGESLVLIDTSEFVCEPKYHEWGYGGAEEMYLREGTLALLRKAKKELPKGLNFKLWDCYRPVKVQQALFENCKKSVKEKHPKWSEEQVFNEARKFIAIPGKEGEVPPHNTGGTADLTLVTDSGEELNMGTEFDEFGEECHPEFFHEIAGRTPEEDAIVRNRDVLTHAMTSVGFRRDIDEWWHFDYGNQLWALELNKPYAIYGSAERMP